MSASSSALSSFVSVARGCASCFGFFGGVVVVSLPRLGGGCFARASALRRVARLFGLSALVVASPLSCGGGGVLVVVGLSAAACWAWPGVWASLVAGAAVVGSWSPQGV